MPIVPGDWSVDEATGNIRYIGDDHGGGSPSYATVIELRRWLGGLSDDLSFVGDDEYDITKQAAAARSTDNIITLLDYSGSGGVTYNIDDNASEHLYDGSIVQRSGAEIYDGFVVIGASTNVQIIQDGAVLADDWWNSGSGLNPDAANGISHRFMLKVRTNDANIDGRRIIATSRNFGNTFGEFRINGTSRGNNVIALTESSDLNNQTSAGTVATWTTIVNDNEGYIGIDADGNGANEFYYSNWEYGTQSVNEFYERMKWLTREGSAETLYGLNGELFRGITHEIVYDTLTGTFDEGQDLVWGTEVAYDAELSSGLTVGAYYTFATSGAVGQLLALDDNGTTGFAIFAIESGSGTVVDNDAFTRADGTANDGATVNVTVNNPLVAGGKGRILADNGSDRVWIQILKGSAPVDNLPIWEATTAGVYDNATGDNAAVNVTVTERAISTPFVGASTGSAIIGAYGFGIGADDLTASDLVTALDGTARTPPNNVTFTVAGLVSGEDTVLVGPESGGTINKAQMSLQTTLNTDNITSVQMTASAPGGTPSTGTIRVIDDAGLERRLVYTGLTTTTLSDDTFTIDPTASEAVVPNVADFAASNATAGNGAYVSYIDKVATGTQESVTVVYPGSDVAVFVRVRDGGGTPIQPFETPSTIGSGGGSVTAIRTSDE